MIICAEGGAVCALCVCVDHCWGGGAAGGCGLGFSGVCLCECVRVFVFVFCVDAWNLREKDQCKAPNPCKHGGTFDSKTKACINCAGAWGGPKCDVYNPTKMPLAKLLALQKEVSDNSQAALDAQMKLNPFCAQGEVNTHTHTLS